MTPDEARVVRNRVKKAQQALKAACAESCQARSARRMAQHAQADGVMRKQRPRRRLVTAIAAEEARATGARAANVPARICMLFIQSTIIWASHPRCMLPTYNQPELSVPFEAPLSDDTSTALPYCYEHRGERVFFAVCAMIEILFGRGAENFATGSFASAMRALNQKAGSHLGAIVRALPQFREARAFVLENLAGIQALVVEAIPHSTLEGAAMERACLNSGLVPVSAGMRSKVAAHTRTFAETPAELRADLKDIIDKALPEFERDWKREPIPACQGSCGTPGCAETIVDEDTVKAALIDGMWSEPST